MRICIAAVAEARLKGWDIVILDTAGRLTIDAPLMKEIVDLAKALKACETLLVVDAMTGQEAVNVAEAFHAAVPITGLVLTKIDGDARGGAALSISAVTGLPVKFLGTGEKTDALEPFHPDRLASRILGMGDVMTLVERAQEHFDEKQAAKMAEKLRKNSFTLQDMLDQMAQLNATKAAMSAVLTPERHQSYGTFIENQREMKKRLGVGADTLDTLGEDASLQVIDENPDDDVFNELLQR